MPVLIGQRDDVVRTLAGHVVGFREGKETFVPDNQSVIKACVERGHSIKKEEAPKVAEPAPAKATAAK